MPVPTWVQDAVFYQIFPDRFANGDRRIDPSNVQSWGAAPTVRGFQGGDLRGVIDHFEYLLDLGITAIYLNPIFQSASNHRYNATDYFKIDPRLGDLQVFRELLDTAHRHNVRVILDGVFNHCGRGFFAFNDLLENQEESAYKDWFYVHRFPVDGYSPGPALQYDGCWQLKSMPKLNPANPWTRAFLLEVVRYWIDQGADGWRIDVPKGVKDRTFWGEVRAAVKRLNPDAYLLGEIWALEPGWVGEGHFDGLMNYPVRDAVLDLLAGGGSIVEFDRALDGIVATYPAEHLDAMYVPLGSHDTQRLMTRLNRHAAKARLAFLIQFGLPGAPAIYYGDEIGMEGGKDPDCRRAFPWSGAGWNRDLRAHVKLLIELRKKYKAMRRGAYKRVWLDQAGASLAFVRRLAGQTVLIGINASSQRKVLRVPTAGLGWSDGRPVEDLLNSRTLVVARDTIDVQLEAWSGTWLA